MEPNHLERIGSVTACPGWPGTRSPVAGLRRLADREIAGENSTARTFGGWRREGWLARFFPLAFLLLTLAQPGLGSADIYSFVDETGITHFSNVPQDRRYRAVLRTSEALTAPGLRYSGIREAARQFAHHVRLFGSAGEVSPALIHAVISAESGYNPNARSRKGAMGLMQLMPDTALRYQVADPYDPEQNIRGGVSYLRDLMRQFDNDLPLVLAAYNAGEGAVQRYGRRIPPFAETRQYVPRVLDLYDRYLRDERLTRTAAVHGSPEADGRTGASQ